MHRSRTSLVSLFAAAAAAAAAGCVGGSAHPSPPLEPSLASHVTVPAASNLPSRSTEDIGALVRARQPQLHFCYQEGLTRNPQLAGSATVAIAIAGNGRISQVEIVGRSWQGSGVQETESCVVAMVARWTFPPSAIDESIHSFLLSFTR